MLDLPPPDPALEIVIASQGMSKGIRQTDGVQLVVRPELASGPLFVGGLVKNVSSTSADFEVHALLGLRGEAAGFDLSASAAAKFGVGGRGHADRDSVEFQLAASRAFGPLTPRIALTWSPDDLGGVGESLYAELTASLRLGGHASLSAGLGRRERAGAPDYTAFNAGASWSFSRTIALDLRYYDTAQSGLGAVYEPRLVGALRLRF
ncbi:MAG TPA: hypothetical protein VGW40_13380 [Allosphingosinicella sp.]|nr:hypothetical protein [Allosphingosinicella sp.]